MKYLLDTHVWLWMQTDPSQFSQRMTEALLDERNGVLLSAASSWEIAIKYSLGKLPLPVAPEEYVPDRLKRSGTKRLPVKHLHALRVARLPHHHRDPFDRLLIAQAQLDRLTLVTVDPAFALYDVNVVHPKRAT